MFVFLSSCLFACLFHNNTFYVTFKAECIISSYLNLNFIRD